MPLDHNFDHGKAQNGQEICPAGIRSGTQSVIWITTTTLVAVMGPPALTSANSTQVSIKQSLRRT